MNRKIRLKDSERYVYQGPLGEVVKGNRYFFAWKDGHILGTFDTLQEAILALVWKEKVETISQPFYHRPLTSPFTTPGRQQPPPAARAGWRPSAQT